ncbi:MAG: nucleoside monophosphate kinase, partial [Chitinivibrionales bacterium]
DILLLNGIPRHVEQAEQLDKIISIKKVINLRCSPEVVIERIKKDTGGDRAERTDDSPEEIREKIETFNTRTVPLVKHYRELGAEVLEFDVDANTLPYDIYKKL